MLLTVSAGICLIVGAHLHRSGPPAGPAPGEEKGAREIIAYLRAEQPRMEEEHLALVARTVFREGRRHDIDYRLILAVMKVESNFIHHATSAKGARGLLQVKPSLARGIADHAGVTWRGAKTLDGPEENIKIGVYFLRQLLGDFDSLTKALQAYNMGPARLRELKSGRQAAAKGYLKKVYDEYARTREILPAPEDL